MASDTAAVLDEAYQRLHKTGPEFDGWLSNHGPMAAEAMARNGHAEHVHPWLDGYVRRLEEFPRGSGPIGADWQEALGDPRRIADWTTFFCGQTAGQPWRQIVGTWWPRLLPGAAASATHGIIRVGHAVRALVADGGDAVHVTELAHGLAYWAARWQPVPGTETRQEDSPAAAESGRRAAALTPAAALAAVPRIADQSGGFRDRLSRLAKLPGWPAALAAAPAQVSADEARAWLAGLADAAVFRYLQYGHGNPVMLVHAATAPTAILRTLPVLGQDLWAPSAAAAWDAAAAITAIYAPPAPAPRESLPEAPAGPGAADEAFARAVRNGDEHAIKFADTAAEVHARTGDPAALAAAAHAAALIPRQT
jgi:Questin oxidase-like